MHVTYLLTAVVKRVPQPDPALPGQQQEAQHANHHGATRHGDIGRADDGEVDGRGPRQADVFAEDALAGLVGSGVEGGVDGGGVDGGGVGVGAAAGPGAADTADLAALGQASTRVSETAAGAIVMIAPSPMRRTFMSPDCPLGSARRSRFPSRHYRSPSGNPHKEDACETPCAELHSAYSGRDADEADRYGPASPAWSPGTRSW